jgi:hypothetical protein
MITRRTKTRLDRPVQGYYGIIIAKRRYSEDVFPVKCFIAAQFQEGQEYGRD